MQKNSFVKSHGLGNTYIVLEEDHLTFALTESAVRRICDVHFGVGSDGILLKVKADTADFGVRIFNPDGSEAEKSGNGLRIFAKYLYDTGYPKGKTFTIQTLGGLVRAQVVEEKNGHAVKITADMGRAVFASRDIPTLFEAPGAINQTLRAGDAEYTVHCVSVGNPHCVVIKDALSEEEIRSVGPLLETHPMFPNKINVQFARVLSRDEAEILVWERGAGYTLASGSSSCAVACVLKKLGLVDSRVKIRMPGGALDIEISEDWRITMTGPVQETARGVLSGELIAEM